MTLIEFATIVAMIGGFIGMWKFSNFLDKHPKLHQRFSSVLAVLVLLMMAYAIGFGIYKAVTDREGEKVWVEDAQQYCIVQIGNDGALCPGRAAVDGYYADSYERAMKIRKNLLSDGCAVSPMPYRGEFGISYSKITANDIMNCHPGK